MIRGHGVVVVETIDLDGRHRVEFHDGAKMEPGPIPLRFARFERFLLKMILTFECFEFQLFAIGVSKRKFKF